jgi:hypothetical protein
MLKIFISYRREDSIALTGRLCDRLRNHFSHESIFMDVDTIPFGVDFRRYLSEAVGQCDVLLAIIGERWSSVDQEGRRRIDDPKDFVRVEIEAALKRDIPVIPVLLDNVSMPREEQLPSTLADLAYRNACSVDSGRDFHNHADRLIRGLEYLQGQNANTFDGKWIGKLSGTSGDLNYTLTLSHKENNITGTALGENVHDPKRWVLFNLRGTLIGDALSFEQYEIADGNPPNSWCLIEGILHYSMSQGIETLVGDWKTRDVNSNPTCRGVNGSLRLERRKAVLS